MMKTRAFVFCCLPMMLLFGRIGRTEGRRPRVLIVAPERTGVLQTGGLAHATTGLASALNQSGIPTDFLMPYYAAMQTPPNLHDLDQRFAVPLDWRGGVAHKTSYFDLYQSISPHLKTYFLKHLRANGERDYFDNVPAPGQTRKTYGPEAIIGESFGAFSKAAADFILAQHYDVVILNDWMCGLIATYLREARDEGRTSPRVIFALHNIAFQGLFPKSLVDYLGLSNRHFHIDGYEFYNQVNFLKAGLQFSDFAYTVSPQYLREIATPRFGMGLDGLVRHLMSQHRMAGILNGIDSEAWDPSQTGAGRLPFPFSVKDLSGKAKGKRWLQKKWGLEESPFTPLFVSTSRLAEQKGPEYLFPALTRALQQHALQLVIIGDGDARYVQLAHELQEKFPRQVHYEPFSAEDERLAIAYGDFFINGAWFEPSGLNQFFALANGTVPLVSHVGGLKSSVLEGRNGLTFSIAESTSGAHYDTAATAENAYQALERALDLYVRHQSRLKDLQTNGMREDHSWPGRIHDEFAPMFEFVLNEGPNRIAEDIRSRQNAVRPSEFAQFAGLKCEQYLMPTGND